MGAHADIAIIGNGIIGLSCAWYLQQQGVRCLLLDPEGFGQGASFGNAGALSFANVFPQSHPRVAGQGLRMLLDESAPLKLDWGAWPVWSRWLPAFVKAGKAPHIPAQIEALHRLNAPSRQAWLELADAIGAQDGLKETGYLHLYSDAENFAADAWKRKEYERLGYRYRCLDTKQLHDLEPHLGDVFCHGVWQEESLFLDDPGAFCQRLGKALLARGARQQRSKVQQIQREQGHYRLKTDHDDVLAEQVVLATGARANELLRPFGVKLPLTAGRGYHRRYPSPASSLNRPALWIERYIVLSPMQGALRLTGLKDLTHPDRAPRHHFLRRRQHDAQRFLPGLGTTAQGEWFGDRPLTPDSLPIIDRLADENIHIATGHGHLGMTQGPITGQCIAAQVVQYNQLIFIEKFRIERFF